jgi:hypothetical protein
MKIEKYNDNIHRVSVEGNKLIWAQLGCIHWDNPKCDRDRLKKDLEYCKSNSIPIMLNGDVFCLMQGRGDRRGNKSDIRPEHNNSHYLDSIVDTAVEYFSPYAHLLTVVGYGNHETTIIKYQETDVLKRFVEKMNYVNNTNIQIGGYGGWILWRLTNKYKESVTFKHKYFHGSGGGGIVTKGAINLTRALEMLEGMDSFGMNHIHENWARNDVRDTIENKGKGIIEHTHKEIHLAVCGTYKEEYGTGAKGWHIERGAPPKPIGGRLFTMEFKRSYKDGKKSIKKFVDSCKFPLL